MLQTNNAEITFLEGIFNYSVEEKLNLLFRSYFKRNFFPRRAAQYWKSLLKGTGHSPSKEVFKAELETARVDQVCCWGWWGALAWRDRALVVFPIINSGKGSRPLPGSDTRNQQKKIIPCEKVSQVTGEEFDKF